MRTGLVLGTLLLVACVTSIATYLVVVGFEPDGGWLVEGTEMIRIVISSDVMAAVISVTILLGASRLTRQRTAQPSPQS
jgi:glycosyltransferase A (GT-A) superfamily protein (DUF2064 family)